MRNTLLQPVLAYSLSSFTSPLHPTVWWWMKPRCSAWIWAVPSGAGDIISIQRLDSNDQGIKLQAQVPAQTPSQRNSKRAWAISHDVTHSSGMFTVTIKEQRKLNTNSTHVQVFPIAVPHRHVWKLTTQVSSWWGKEEEEATILKAQYSSCDNQKTGWQTQQVVYLRQRRQTRDGVLAPGQLTLKLPAVNQSL